MKRLLVTLLVGGLVGAVMGFAGGIFVYPFWFLNDVASETLGGGVERERFATGKFIHVNPSDPIHWGRGSVTLYREAGDRSVVHLHDNFEVGPGPRFHVYLVDHAMVDSGEAFTASDKIDLGRLRAFKGSQIYEVPDGADAAKYRSVVIWCKEFGVLISPASLTSVTAGAAQGSRPSGRSG